MLRTLPVCKVGNGGGVLDVGGGGGAGLAGCVNASASLLLGLLLLLSLLRCAGSRQKLSSSQKKQSFLPEADEKINLQCFMQIRFVGDVGHLSHRCRFWFVIMTEFRVTV